jgi:CHAT domain-containing protein
VRPSLQPKDGQSCQRHPVFEHIDGYVVQYVPCSLPSDHHSNVVFRSDVLNTTPSLALTLPKQPTELDDGLLTASEVAQLKLNADWVVLSACNTAAADKPGAEALSGLARAFFYAGARALLVSHWSVDSEAATRLTTSTFAIMKADPKLGRAEALRNAMLTYMNDKGSPLNAYPAFWAPFSIIGEGAAR